jgi:hypothetical protein
MIIRVEAYDGKEFKGLDIDKLIKECNAYEADLRLKKEKEETERKTKAEAKEKAIKWVTDSIDLVNQAVERYENETGKQLIIYTLNGKLTASERITTNSTHYVPCYYGF